MNRSAKSQSPKNSREETNESTLAISDAYRKSRKTVSILSGIAVAWATAQFEFSSISLGSFGEIIMARYSVPITLAICISYTMIMCTVEYMMQSTEVRKWNIAQFDYQLILMLASIAILMLSATGISRTLAIVFFIVILSIILFVGQCIFLAAFWALFLILNLKFNGRKYILKYKGKLGIIPMIWDSMNWASVVSALATMILGMIAGKFLLDNGFKILGLKEQPEALPIAVFYICFSGFIISLLFQNIYLYKVFSFTSPKNAVINEIENCITGGTIEKNNANQQERENMET